MLIGTLNKQALHSKVVENIPTLESVLVRDSKTFEQ